MSAPAERPETTEPDVTILARTIYGEARGESVRGKEAVAAVVMNRFRRARERGGYWWGDTVGEVCLRPWQFSCWNKDDPNFEKIVSVKPADRVFGACLRIARRAVGGVLADPTGGATHYHAKGVFPPWARGRVACFEVGRHQFYNTVE